MTQYRKLAEQHIIQYQSRLKHIDELMERARKDAGGAPETPEVSKELADLMEQRDKLAGRLEELRVKSLDDWRQEDIEKAGPMGVWDAVAQQLEKLVERLER